MPLVVRRPLMVPSRRVPAKPSIPVEEGVHKVDVLLRAESPRRKAVRGLADIENIAYTTA